MLAVNLLRFQRVSYTVFVRNLRKSVASGPNPGLDKRVQVFKKEGIALDHENIEEFIEQSESDFSHAGLEYNDFLREKKAGKDLLRMKIVRDKYFKENLPNLLTWSEKEQIRHLNSTEPDEWTPEKIAESFPVTAEVVKKLLKYPWKPASEERIARHDASAMRNWRDLKEGTLKIPEDLKKQLLKFSNRTIPPLSAKSIKLDLTQEKIGEFQKIVEQCANIDETIHNNTSSNNNNYNQETKPDKPLKKREKNITLDELKNRIQNRLTEGNSVDLEDQLILNSEDKSKQNELTNNKYPLVEMDPNKSVVEYQDQRDGVVEIRTYPERIRIPKKSFKWGATYKVKDCFYDCDGRFLYRVIGLDENAPQIQS